MKKTLLIPAAWLLLNTLSAQDTVRVSVCTKFWSNNAPVTATKIKAHINISGLPAQSQEVILDATQNCADFEFVTSQYPPDATFSFSASKEQDNPLNGVTMLDLIKVSSHILGLDPIESFGLIAADVNLSQSVTTFDIVEPRKLITGIYTSWPNAPVWRFIPDYWLPFLNPSNPFGGISGSAQLSISELQALHGNTIELIGVKTGDVDGDANSMNPFHGPVGDSTALVLPDIILEAGVPVDVPLNFYASMNLTGMQFELLGAPGIIHFDTLTAALSGGAFFSNTLETGQSDAIRAVYWGSQQTDGPSFNLRLTSNTTIALKDAISIKANALSPLLADDNGAVYGLYLNFSNAVGTQNPVQPGLRMAAAAPNPFGAQAQVQIELDQPETIWFEVMDLTGKTLLRQQQQLTAGIHHLTIPGALVPENATVIYRVSAGQFSTSGKLQHGQ